MSESLSPRAKKQRRKLLDRAAQALAQHPGSGMVELAKLMDVSRATLYRYFPTREELVRELALESLRATDEACEGIYDGVTSYREAFRRTFEALIPLGATYHFLDRESSLYSDREVMAGVERQTAAISQMIDDAMAAGELDPTLPTAWVAKHFDALIWLAWSEVRNGYVARREVAALAFRTFWRGVAAESSPE